MNLNIVAICIVLLVLGLTLMIFSSFKLKYEPEHYTTTTESIQNISSLYNNENLTVTNLKVTGNLDVVGNITVSGGVTSGGNISSGGSINSGGTITSKNDIIGQSNITASNNLTVGSNATVGNNLAVNQGTFTAGRGNFKIANSGAFNNGILYVTSTDWQNYPIGGNINNQAATVIRNVAQSNTGVWFWQPHSGGSSYCSDCYTGVNY